MRSDLTRMILSAIDWVYWARNVQNSERIWHTDLTMMLYEREPDHHRRLEGVMGILPRSDQPSLHTRSWWQSVAVKDRHKGHRQEQNQRKKH